MSTLQDFGAAEPTTDDEDECDCDELRADGLPCWHCVLTGAKTVDDTAGGVA